MVMVSGPRVRMITTLVMVICSGVRRLPEGREVGSGSFMEGRSFGREVGKSLRKEPQGRLGGPSSFSRGSTFGFGKAEKWLRSPPGSITCLGFHRGLLLGGWL